MNQGKNDDRVELEIFRARLGGLLSGAKAAKSEAISIILSPKQASRTIEALDNILEDYDGQGSGKKALPRSNRQT